MKRRAKLEFLIILLILYAILSSLAKDDWAPIWVLIVRAYLSL